MALIEHSKGRKEGSGYERLVGNKPLGHLLSRVQATVISSGTELEKIIIGKSEVINDVDAFLENQKLPHGIYLIPKQVIKKSKLRADKEPDLIIFKIDDKTQHCFIIELKDGDTFDTKKSAGEIEYLSIFENHLSKKIVFTTSTHVCCFNQLDKKRIVEGFKKGITFEQAMTGKELCDLLGINYENIVQSRKHDQTKNLDFFIESILQIDKLRKMIIEKLQDKNI